MLLAIDPGTYRCGYALFDDGKIQEMGVFCPDKNGALLTRITEVCAFVEGFISDHYDVDEVACESWGGPRNESLQVLIRTIGDTVKGMGRAWARYPSSTVMASVRPSGMPAKSSEQRKQCIRTGILALHPYLRSKLAKYDPRHIQDAIDAVAVGECHMGKEREKRLESHQEEGWH